MASVAKRHACELLQFHAFDCLVLDNSVSSASCDELASEFRVRNPKGKVIDFVVENSHGPIPKPDATVSRDDELLQFFRTGTLQPPGRPPMSRTSLIPPPPRGWAMLQKRAQRAKNAAELIPIIDEMNRLLDRETKRCKDGEKLYATRKVKGERSD
jgi:hypothetical protein